MSTGPVVPAHRLLTEAIDALGTAAGTGAEMLSVLTVCEGASRRLDLIAVRTVAALQRGGEFTQRGYRNPIAAVADLLSCDWLDARRRISAAEQVCPRIGLDGTVLPPRLTATAALFETARISLRHIEVLTRLLGTDAAGRLTPAVWAEAETLLAGHALESTPTQLLTLGTALIDVLDADGAHPDDGPQPTQVNELQLRPHRGAPGGRITARLDDAALYDAIATAIDAHSAPVTADDERTAPQRRAQALADLCTQVLTHGQVPESGGRRPHLNVLIRLEDLEHRARAAMLDLGGTLTPETLRMLACDAAIIPIVLGSKGQPLDIGRLTRTIPDSIRRAAAARDGGCARCGRPPGWCEVHHIRTWEDGGDTTISNCVMLCRVCHRLIHHSGWQVRLVNDRPEFLPPKWIDPDRIPRQRPMVHLIDFSELDTGTPTGAQPAA